MGNCMETTNSGEDVGMDKHGMRAVGTDGAYVDDSALSLLINQACELKSKVQIRIKCQGLPKLDAKSKSDPFCVLWHVNQQGKKVKIGLSDIVVNNQDPEFLKAITMDYFFEEQQKMMVDVYDADDIS